MTTADKILIFDSAEAPVILAALEQARPGTFTPSQQKRLPDICRALGRWIIAEAEELQEELAERQLEAQRRGRGRPTKYELAARADFGLAVAAARACLQGKPH